ncbi:putative metal-dependent hydrolase of the TIM-barrel fold protein [Limihaloglobus sulfuriphilus]|uniref:Putative metal-dependent hydrolase of the TIM-barrel fold protein n=1 Tax=Limihaloglobus sulfuriphilus TaxID=1851148 RepID=A0A1Q2MAS9_9BACT|nr:amidohydrolase family protein [Limihaloglobus sulfuriphilus]AQQ69833.1 putative metal-dependent hydrolase of the TIM-barrel fold protein [Limihaloglobus sulfuriphilus]
MIFDCHTHITDESGSYNVEFADHAAGLGGMIVLARIGEDNRKVSELAAKFEKTVTFGFIDPSSEKKPAEAVEKIARKAGCRGLVVYCGETAMHPCHSSAMVAFEAAQRLGLPIFFHNECWGETSVLDYTQPVHLDELARTFPQLKMIIGSMARPFYSQTLELTSRHENVYGCLPIYPKRAWELYNTVISIFEAGAEDKILFGSGYPDNNAKESIEALLGLKLAFSETNLPWVGSADLRKLYERDCIEVLGLSVSHQEGQ